MEGSALPEMERSAGDRLFRGRVDVRAPQNADVGSSVVHRDCRVRDSRVRAVSTRRIGIRRTECGVPTPPEKIRALMDSMNRQKLAHTLPRSQEEGDGQGA